MLMKLWRERRLKKYFENLPSFTTGVTVSIFIKKQKYLTINFSLFLSSVDPFDFVTDADPGADGGDTII